MIDVTERAKDFLVLIAENATVAETALRLAYSGPNELTLTFDKEKPGDHIVEHNEVKVLLIDNVLSQQMTGSIVDIDESPSGTTLRIRSSEEFLQD